MAQAWKLTAVKIVFKKTKQQNPHQNNTKPE